jgi:hypothetical protein
MCRRTQRAPALSAAAQKGCPWRRFVADAGLTRAPSDRVARANDRCSRRRAGNSSGCAAGNRRCCDRQDPCRWRRRSRPWATAAGWPSEGVNRRPAGGACRGWAAPPRPSMASTMVGSIPSKPRMITRPEAAPVEALGPRQRRPERHPAHCSRQAEPRMPVRPAGKGHGETDARFISLKRPDPAQRESTIAACGAESKKRPKGPLRNEPTAPETAWICCDRKTTTSKATTPGSVRFSSLRDEKP